MRFLVKVTRWILVGDVTNGVNCSCFFVAFGNKVKSLTTIIQSGGDDLESKCTDRKPG